VSLLRLAMVARQFWPLVGGAARAGANLATTLASRGVEVTVLAARWGPRWPAEIGYSGVNVLRIAEAPRSAWGSIRYVRSLARWLRQNQDRYQLVYVWGLKEEAYAALCAVGGGVPVVLRPQVAGRRGDCLWQLDARCGRRIKHRCMHAAAFVGPSRAVWRELIAAGYDRTRIHYLPDGVPIPQRRTEASRTAARAALAAAYPALCLEDNAPLVLYTGRLEQTRGLDELVAAWEPISSGRPEARLWLAGEGSYRTELCQQIEARNLAPSVVLPGTFDRVDELLSAADLFVLPRREGGTSLALLEAMAAGLPVLAVDTPSSRDTLTDGREGLLVREGNCGAMSAAIGRLLDHPELAERLGAAARQRAAAHFPLAKTVDAHVTLFESLLDPDGMAVAPPVLLT